MNTRLLLLHALSPLHAGTGQGVGAIDLPIARERATNLPFVPGSTIKGVLRDHFNDESTQGLQKKIFGPKTDNAEDHAGSAQFADAHLLLFPVRSVLGTFAWVTSPYVLRRFLRDLTDAGITGAPAISARPTSDGHCIVASAKSAIQNSQTVYLEDLDLAVEETTTDWTKWLGERIFPREQAWQEAFAARFCIVSDNVLNFLLDTATEITARIKLQDDAKTVQQGGLWYEESLPTETILSGLVIATPTKKADITPERIFTELQKHNGKMLQVGGKATVGRGLVRLHIGN